MQKHQLFATIDKEGNVVDEATTKPFFASNPSVKEFLFWRNLRKNNVHINEDYPYVSRVANDFVFVISANKPVVFHSYISKDHAILRDSSVVVDEDVPDAKTRHGVLIYGSNIAVPFIPKYLSMNVETNSLYFPLMNSHVGGLGKLNTTLENYFKQFIRKSDDSVRSGYMFRFINHDYDVESVDLKAIRG
ncbi:hypothetical protein WA538_005286 [Blastocystis sp. DL]